MIIDFSKVNLDDRPLLLLKTLDGRILEPLGRAFNTKLKLNYDDISEITFDFPATDNEEKVSGFNRIKGMRIVDLVGIGQFILVNPETVNDGVREVKSCKGYSLEYEFTRKKLTLPKGTYNFYNNIEPKDTVLGIVLEYMPSWTIGSVDTGLIGKYRTFEVNNENIYNFIKSTLQKTYGCIFEFDTYNRQINVKDVNKTVDVEPVYISLENLAKEIKIVENTEDIFTVLDVSGADGVNIRDVNPLGTNKIYNLDYYMADDDNFPAELKAKWNDWKNAYNEAKVNFDATSAQRIMSTAKKATAEAKLTTLNGILQSYENIQSVRISNKVNDPNAVYESIEGKLNEARENIENQKAIIQNIQEEIDNCTNILQEIISSIRFKNYFTPQELTILECYFREGEIEDSSFVASDVVDYAADEKAVICNGSISVTITGADVTIFGEENKTYTPEELKNNSLMLDQLTRFFASKGHIAVNEYNEEEKAIENEIISAENIRTSYQYISNDGKEGEISLVSYLPKECLLLSGSVSSISYDINNTSLTIVLSGTQIDTKDPLQDISKNPMLYRTSSNVEFQRSTVEQNLFDYGTDTLKKLSQPSYEFSVSAANFLAIDDFIAFKNKLTLGHKIYLQIEKNGEQTRVLNPILTSAEISYEDLTTLNLEFGNKYSSSEASFKLMDLLEESVSMGKSVDVSKYTYSAFIDSNASNSVHQFMNSALDVAKNAILSANGQGVSWDASGFKLRKKDANGNYEKEQIAMINNSIVMTDDLWQTVKVAIGKQGDSWGVIADNIIGNLIAGKNLIISANKNDEKGNSIMKFLVDSDGVKLYNADFMLNDGKTCILLNPKNGIVIGDSVGTENILSSEGKLAENFKEHAKFYIDPDDGTLHIKGALKSTSIDAGKASAFHVDSDGNMWIGSQSYNNAPFKVDESGNLYANQGNFSGTLNSPTLDGFIKTRSNSLLLGNELGSENYWLTGCGIRVGANTNSEKYNFYVDNSGNVYMRGNIELGGNITWSSESSPVKVLYAQSNLSVPLLTYDNYNDHDSYDWHKIFNQSDDKFVSYSYDGGTTWTNAVKFNTNITFDDIAEQFSNQEKSGLYCIQGKFYIKANAINATEGILIGDNKYGYLIGYTGSTTSSGTKGIALSSDNDSSIACTVTDGGAYLKAKSGSGTAQIGVNRGGSVTIEAVNNTDITFRIGGNDYTLSAIISACGLENKN